MLYKSSRGFSLIEVMVTLAIFLIITAAIFLTLATGRMYWYTGSVQLTVHQEARRGLEYMTGELRQSSLAKISFSGQPDAEGYYNNITFNIPQDRTSPPDGNIATNGSVEWSDNITYSLNNNQLIRTPSKGTGATDVLANNIVGLRFKRSEVLDVEITSQKQTTQQYPVSSILQTQVKLRN